MTFSEPWRAVTTGARWVDELHRELPRGHVVDGVPVRAIARREDRDDVLFALDDDSGRVAAVHLTFNVEQDPSWPKTRLFASMEAFAASCMNTDCL